MTILQFLLVAVVFTILGFIWGIKFGIREGISILIAQGYVKTVNENDKIRIVKHRE